MVMGECSANNSLQVNSKVKLAAWPTSWWPPSADRLSLRAPKVNSHIWLHVVDDSTINTVLCITTIIIYYYYKLIEVTVHRIVVYHRNTFKCFQRASLTCRMARGSISTSSAGGSQELCCKATL